MMLQKRGQAAMEFLMTYGWAILVVLIAIAALAYFGVLNPGRFLPTSCTIMPGISCEDIVVNSNGDVALTLRNGLANNLEGFTVTLYLSDSITPICDPLNPSLIGPTRVSVGELATFTKTGCNTGPGGSKFKADIEVRYTAGGTLTHARKGMLTTQVEGGGVYVPPPTANCTDSIQNQGETGVDCGGPCGATCDIGEGCIINTDCISNNCIGGICSISICGLNNASLCNNLVGYWSMDRYDVNLVYDNSTKGHNARYGPNTDMSNINTAGCKYGGCLRVYKDGAVQFQESLNVTDHNDLDLGNTYTILAWIKPALNNFQGYNTYSRLIDKGRTGTYGDCYEIDTVYRAVGPDVWLYVANTSSTTVYANITSNPLTYTANTWYYMVSIMNNKMMSVYIYDEIGNLYTSTITPKSLGDGNQQQGNDPLIIGNSWGVDRPFNGWIDELRVYNGRALTQQEILDSMNDHLP